MTKILAHRANGFGYIENSLEAIKKALESDIDGIELDLHLTKDKHILVIHDAYLDRISSLTGLLNQFTKTELQKERLHGGQRFAFLEELMPLFKKHKNKTIILECKEDIAVQKIGTLLKKYNCFDTIIIGSWHPPYLEKLYHHNNTIKTLLFYFPLPLFMGLFRFRRKKIFDHDTITFHINKKPKSTSTLRHVFARSRIPRVKGLHAIAVPAALMSPRLLRSSIHTYVWVVNSPPQYTHLKNKKVTGVITDRPQSLR